MSLKELRWNFSDFSSADIILKQRRFRKPGKIGVVAQVRALSALELGLGIKQRGYNIFVVGVPGTGRTSTVQKILSEQAIKEDSPNDLVLLYNFDDRDRPLAVMLPTSFGPKLKKSYETLMERVQNHLERAFDSESYLLSRQAIGDRSRNTTEEALSQMEEEAQLQNFVLNNNGVTITLTPANKKGEPITEEEFDKLSEKQKQSLEQKAQGLEGKLDEAMRKVRHAEKESEDDLQKLQGDTAKQAISSLFESARSSWKSHKSIIRHLSLMEEDIVSKIKRFIPDDKIITQEQNEHQNRGPQRRRFSEDEEDFDMDEPLFIRYRVNVLVSYTKTSGAPVVFETHPTSSNLIGRIEQRVRSGETITDFTRIRAGALYKANGGYLILEATELLRDPSAWEGLKRALKNREIELDDPGEPGRMVTVASLRPEPVPLSLKVLLIGPPEIYYALARNDVDFQTLFKVKADFELEAALSDDNLERYIHFLAEVAHDEGLLKLNSTGAARILEEAVRMAGSKNKITCRLGEIADILREANFWAKKQKSIVIEKKHVLDALLAKAQREGFVQSQVIDDIKTGKILIDISSKIIGQANALTVVEIGSYEFGVPLRVTCQISAGKGEIIDIEREAEQGGPFHSKGRMIIRGYLSNIFGHILPFGFHATLCMEQTYSDIDGDSASMAEACALISSLAQVPLDQRYAMTGAIDQMGHVQAVGGINQKIEGFYEVVKVKDGSDFHGVIIPEKNIDDIMLKEEVLQAVSEGKFKIISVGNIEDALEILTGITFDGDKTSLKSRAIEKLKHFNYLRRYDKHELFSKLGQVTERKFKLGEMEKSEAIS